MFCHHPLNNRRAWRKDDCDDTRTIVNLFDDGVFYRCGFIIQAEHNRKRHEKCRGTLWHEVVHFQSRSTSSGLSFSWRWASDIVASTSSMYS